ncbi:hypothetical protein P9112_009531 [Eukaryota sp. TZLM1-RC]
MAQPPNTVMPILTNLSVKALLTYQDAIEMAKKTMPGWKLCDGIPSSILEGIYLHKPDANPDNELAEKADADAELESFFETRLPFRSFRSLQAALTELAPNNAEKDTEARYLTFGMEFQKLRKRASHLNLDEQWWLLKFAEQIRPKSIAKDFASRIRAGTINDFLSLVQETVDECAAFERFESYKPTMRRPFNAHNDPIYTTEICYQLSDNRHAPAVKDVIIKFNDVFNPRPHPDGLDVPSMEMSFDDESKCVKLNPRSLNPRRLAIAKELMNEFIELRVAKEVSLDSEYMSPIVHKEYEHRGPKLCGDYTKVNELSKTFEAVIPRAEHIFAKISKAKFIATFDLKRAFHQLNIAKKDQAKTTIGIPGMAIQYSRAAFGLKNVPGYFQDRMNAVFKTPYSDIYIDDLIVLAGTFEDLLTNLDRTLARVRNIRARLSGPKTVISDDSHSITILGSDFRDGKRHISPSRASAITSLPFPKSQKQLRAFLGSANYVRDFIPNHASLSVPLYKLLQKGQNFKISPVEERNIQQIKTAIKNAVPLTLPEDNQQIVITTDASDVGVGGAIWTDLSNNPNDAIPLEQRLKTIVATLKPFKRC